MAKVYMLIIDQGYEGYMTPDIVWLRPPTEDDIRNFLIEKYMPTVSYGNISLIEIKEARMKEINEAVKLILNDKHGFDYELHEMDVTE